MKYFGGTYEHSLDERFRLAIPSRLRERLGDSLVVTRGTKASYLAVYPAADWDEHVAPVLAISPFDSQGQDLRLSIFPHLAECEIDKQGRILIPPTLRKYAGIVDNVIIAGVGDHVQIWAPAAWEEKNEKLTKDPPDMVYRPTASGRSS